MGVDLLNWRFTFARRMFGPMDMSSFLSGWPVHWTMYELASATGAYDRGDERHLESRKTYYVDFMLWGSPANIDFRKLASRYTFVDTEMDVEGADDPAPTRPSGRKPDFQTARRRRSRVRIDFVCCIPVAPCLPWLFSCGGLGRQACLRRSDVS